MINKEEIKKVMDDIDSIMGKEYSAKTPEVMAAIISAQLQKSTGKEEHNLSYEQPIAAIHDRRSAKR